MGSGKLCAAVAVCTAAVLGLAGCTSNYHTVTTTTTTTTRQVTPVVTSAINAADFDLGTVTSLVTSGQLTDLGGLEAKINDPTSAINNVDVDKDSRVDYVSIRESNNGGELLEFLAHPSSNPNGEPVLVASVRMTTDTVTKQVQVSAAYPVYVNGYQQYGYTYVHPGLTFGDALLLGVLLRPHTYYAPVYMPHTYVSRPVLAGPALQTTRSSFLTTTRVAPVPRTTLANNYQQPASAARVPSQYKAPGATGTITGNAGQMRSFQQRSVTAPKAAGSSFASVRPAVAAPAAPAPPPRTFSAPRSSFGSGSRRR